MNANFCAQCKAAIPLTADQTYLYADDRLISLHIGCADQWAHTELEVYRVSLDGSSYLSLDAPHPDPEATVEKVKITQLAYYQAQAFSGF